LKQGVSPVVAGVIIAVVVIIAAFALWKGTTGGSGSKAPGEVGNTHPLSAGGAASQSGGAKEMRPPGGMPSRPSTTGPNFGAPAGNTGRPGP
jgi:hypothetical protein